MRWLRFSSFPIATVLGIVLAFVRVNGCHYLDLTDQQARDYRLIQRGPRAGSPEIVVVAVDDASLEQFGRWPWSRALMADLVDRLVEADAAVIGFDIIQSESAASPNLETLRGRIPQLDERTWQEVRRFLDEGAANEQRLAESIRASERTVLGYFFDFERRSTDVEAVRLPTYNIVKNSPGGRGEARVPAPLGVQTNLPELSAAARTVGFFNFFPDGDGSYRRAPLTIRFGDQMTVPLSLAMLQVYRPGVPLAVRFAESGVRSIRFGSLSIPVDPHGELLINYRGPAGTFAHVSAADVLAGRARPEQLRGKMVLVGVTATAVADVRVTPFDGSFPGVEVHANVIDNILREDFISRPAWSNFGEALLILLLALSLGSLLHRVRPILGGLAAIALVAGYLLLSQQVFLSYGFLLSLLYPLLAIGLTYAGITLQHYVGEEREKRKIRDAFGLYLNPALARQVSERPELLALGGEKRELTVLFSDIRGFTTISEGLEPEALVEMLNAFLGEMTDEIFVHDGMLDKYIGDAIMAVWGAPLPQSDHATRACRTALAMTARLQQCNREWEKIGWPVLEIGVGLNTGPMVVGNLGSARRLSYTVIGDNVNLASRLEGLNKMYRTQILASETTVLAAREVVTARELDRVRVKGKRLPVRIFEIVAPAEERAAWADTLERFDAGLGAYRQRHWDDAIAAFRSVLEIRPGDGPTQLYLERCDRMLANPPEADWDGVTVMDSK